MSADPQAMEADSSENIGGKTGFGQDRKGLHRGLGEKHQEGKMEEPGGIRGGWLLFSLAFSILYLVL